MSSDNQDGMSDTLADHLATTDDEGPVPCPNCDRPFAEFPQMGWGIMMPSCGRFARTPTVCRCTCHGSNVGE
jgi:hypothetical protein